MRRAEEKTHELEALMGGWLAALASGLAEGVACLEPPICETAMAP